MEIAMDDDFPSFGAFPVSEGEDFAIAEEEENNELSQSTFKGDWKKVVELYETKAGVQRSVIKSSKDTALHMAISDDREDDVEKMVGAIVNNHNKKALKMKNNRGETPLHRAATRKSETMCKCIFEAGQIMGLDLLSITNKWGETPIFMAALYDRKPAFIFLHDAAKDAYPEDPEKPYRFLRRTSGSGDTALHSAIRREYFDLAFHMIILYPDLMGKSDENEMTPLHVLASKPSAFRSGLRLSWWKEIIYYCIRVDKLKYDPEVRTPTSRTSAEKMEDKCAAPDNYLTCYQFLWGAYSVVKKIKEYWQRQAKSSGGELGGKEKGEDLEAPNNSYVNKNIPQNYTTLYGLLVFVYLTLLRFSGFELIVNKIREEKEKHEWSVQILNALMKKHSTAYITDGRDSTRRGTIFDPRQQKSPSTKARVQKAWSEEEENSGAYRSESALFIAARNGVLEVVKKFLRDDPGTIHETNWKGQNVLHVAVEHRQPYIIEILKKDELWDGLVHLVDIDGNSILHLAANFELQTLGSSALEMQNEIKWYEYVKSLMPPNATFLPNDRGKTPDDVFLGDHKYLVCNSDEWLCRTSESCSVVAVLVAGVAFATSTTVPGGNDDKTGKPTLEGQPGFDLFAISALIALCFSVTALILFLSILTSRKHPADFIKKLPVKLLLALSSLFVSIFSMFVSFSAAQSFVLVGKSMKSVVLLYAIIGLPVSFTIVEFPLYMDLFRGIFMKVQPSYNQLKRI